MHIPGSRILQRNDPVRLVRSVIITIGEAELVKIHGETHSFQLYKVIGKLLNIPWRHAENGKLARIPDTVIGIFSDIRTVTLIRNTPEFNTQQKQQIQLPEYSA